MSYRKHLSPCSTGDARSRTTTLEVVSKGSPVPLREVDRFRAVRAAIPEGTWGAPLAHLFDDPEDPAACTDLVVSGLDQPALVVKALFHEVHGGAIIRYDEADDALDLMVYVESPSTVAATDCPVLFADVAVDVDLTVGWNRLRLSRGEGTLLYGHDPDAVWYWD